jgi:hypothetical protein
LCMAVWYLKRLCVKRVVLEGSAAPGTVARSKGQ